MTIVIIKRGKKGKGAPNLGTRGAGARIIVVLFLIIKKTFMEVAEQRKGPFQARSLPAMWRSGADSDRDGALLFVFRQIAPRLSRDAIT